MEKGKGFVPVFAVICGIWEIFVFGFGERGIFADVRVNYEVSMWNGDIIEV